MKHILYKHIYISVYLWSGYGRLVHPPPHPPGCGLRRSRQRTHAVRSFLWRVAWRLTPSSCPSKLGSPTYKVYSVRFFLIIIINPDSWDTGQGRKKNQPNCYSSFFLVVSYIFVLRMTWCMLRRSHWPEAGLKARCSSLSVPCWKAVGLWISNCVSTSMSSMIHFLFAFLRR